MLELLIRLEKKRRALRTRVVKHFGGNTLLAIGAIHIVAALFFMLPMAIPGWLFIGLGVLLLFTVVLAPISLVLL